MENVRKHPFLLSMRLAVSHTGDFERFKTLLLEQHDAFKEYLDEWFYSEKPAPKRFHFLKRAEYELCRLRDEEAEKIRETDEIFYRFWAMKIDDTLRFIATGVETLIFQSNCPAHMLIEASQTFPEYKWMATRTDLSEAIAGIFQVDVIRLKDGSRPSFVPFAKFIGSFFGISYNNPHDDLRKILNRKKNQTPFLNRIIERLKGKSDDENV